MLKKPRMKCKRKSPKSETWNVVPVKDMREHEEHVSCWCKPSIHRERRGRVIVHNSMDGRELVERHGIN